MDLVVITVAGVAAIIVLLALVMLSIRWRRNGYRFSLRKLLAAFAVASCGLFGVMRFVMPTITHRWAVYNIDRSNGGVLFRQDVGTDSLSFHRSAISRNRWRDVDVVVASNDAEAIAVAAQLRHLPEVRQVHLFGAVTDAGLAAVCSIGSHPSLEGIELLGSPVTAAGLSHLAKLKQIRMLFFNTCPIHDFDLECLESLDDIRDLTLLEEGTTANPNRFTEPGFREVGQIKKLEKLWLANLKVSDAAARHLKNLTHLKRLQLSRCQISDEVIAELRQALPQCEVVIYGYRKTITAKK
jgi:hypothetical protein